MSHYKQKHSLMLKTTVFLYNTNLLVIKLLVFIEITKNRFYQYSR
jgi:hypothetical protein